MVTMAVNDRSAIRFVNALAALLVSVLMLLCKTTASAIVRASEAVVAITVATVVRVEAFCYGPIVVRFVHRLTSGFEMYVQETYAEGISGILLACSGGDSLAIRSGGV